MSIQTARLNYDFSDPAGTYVTVTTPGGSVRFGPINARHNTTFYQEQIGIFEPTAAPKLTKKISAKQTKRASIRQENEIMEALGGRRQAGSGAVAHLKGDGRVRDKYRVEVKYTRANSYRVDRKELNKLRGECEGTEIPVFVIDFVDPQTGGSPDRWVMVEFDRFQQLDYKPPNATGNHR